MNPSRIVTIVGPHPALQALLSAAWSFLMAGSTSAMPSGQVRIG